MRIIIICRILKSSNKNHISTSNDKKRIKISICLNREVEYAYFLLFILAVISKQLI